MRAKTNLHLLILNSTLSTKQVTYKNSSLSYYRFGFGSEPIICFAGYAQSGHVFEFLKTDFGKQYSVIAINWFEMENSKWQENNKFTTQHLQLLITEILAIENLKTNHVNLLSFSIGIIPLLAVACKSSFKVKQCIVIAAPGFKFFNLLKFATLTWLGNGVFNLVINKHLTFNYLVKSKIGSLLLGKSKVKLLTAFLSKKAYLLTIKNTWNTMCNLLVTKQQLQEIKCLHLSYIVGRFDKITPPKLLNKQMQKLGSTIIITNNGHKLNTIDNLNALKQLLLKL